LFLGGEVMNLIFLTLSAIIGIGVAIIYNRFVIKGYPDYKRKSGYVTTVVLFLIFALMISCIINVGSIVNSAIKDHSGKLEHHVINNFPENEFVKNGLDLTEINNDIAKLNSTINGLKKILPSNEELGVNKIIYDFVVDYAIKELQKRLNVVENSAKTINSFTEEGNVLTVSSIINGLQKDVIKFINIIVLIIVFIFVLIIVIYVIYTLNVVKRENKYK